MKYLTDREIHVIGIQRTGQHAVTSWLIGHFNSVVYKNCMTQLGQKKKTVGFEFPFWYFTPEGDREWTEWTEWIGYSKVVESKPNAIILGTEFTIFDVGINPNIQQQKNKICTLFDFDDFSKRTDNLLIIRNPYNQYASILNWGKNRLLSPVENFSKMWIKTAKECLGETNVFNNKTVIKYDDWFSSVEERIRIENKLDLQRDDSRLNVVMKIGYGKSWGSSFDGMKKQDNAQEMKVLNRWESVKGNSSFINLTKHTELRELSERFGWECPL